MTEKQPIMMKFRLHTHLYEETLTHLFTDYRIIMWIKNFWLNRNMHLKELQRKFRPLECVLHGVLVVLNVSLPFQKALSTALQTALLRLHGMA